MSASKVDSDVTSHYDAFMKSLIMSNTFLK